MDQWAFLYSLTIDKGFFMLIKPQRHNPLKSGQRASPISPSNLYLLASITAVISLFITHPPSGV
jgi:hypothetical protein|uniref:Uncharacterized protein n=1 Tax=Picea sitchensis TaxID=3332 RepID=A0A6B9XVP5_PICSI|nr:hypothetical protein Q903MT_gene4069 [Picea sitchensis]